jgi:hypothetical protein
MGCPWKEEYSLAELAPLPSRSLTIVNRKAGVHIMVKTEFAKLIPLTHFANFDS